MSIAGMQANDNEILAMWWSRIGFMGFAAVRAAGVFSAVTRTAPALAQTSPAAGVHTPPCADCRCCQGSDRAGCGRRAADGPPAPASRWRSRGRQAQRMAGWRPPPVGALDTAGPAIVAAA